MTEQDALPGLAPPPEQEIDIARVLVDIDLPHLDHPLDYSIPPQLQERAHEGHEVRVKLAGRTRSGWILQRVRMCPEMPLQPLLSVTSLAPVLDPEILSLAQTIARRHVATLSQVLSLALPHRHARTEKAILAETPPTPTPLASGKGTQHEDESVWSHWSGGEALVRHLRCGASPRVVWMALSPYRDGHICALVRATCQSGRSVLLILPTAWQARRDAEMLQAALGIDVHMYGSDLSDAQRQRVHLEGLLGRVRVVVGTRSAIWTPMPSLGLILVWDDGDDHLREIRHPRTDALEVAVVRSHQKGCALVVGSYARSVRAHALVASQWAVSVAPDLATRRALTPRVSVHDTIDIARQGPAGHSRIPPAAMRLLREGLTRGAVLVHVPFAGYIPVATCDRCRRGARCPACSGVLSVNSTSGIRCDLCGRGVTEWRCPHCHGTHVRAGRVGSERTGEELGRAFPGVALTLSNASTPVRRIPDGPRLVVATPGSEPVCESGYAAGVVLDAQAIAGRAELWAPEEALRRWFNAISLLKAQASALIVGGVEPDLAQALVRWDPIDIAARHLDEREALGFFPAATLVALDGPRADVRAVCEALDGEEIGTVPAPKGPEGYVRTIMRWKQHEALHALDHLQRLQQSRSSRKLTRVAVEVNPPELF